MFLISLDTFGELHERLLHKTILTAMCPGPCGCVFSDCFQHFQGDTQVWVRPRSWLLGLLMGARCQAELRNASTSGAVIAAGASSRGEESA